MIRIISRLMIILFMMLSCSSIEQDEELDSEKAYPDQESWSTEIILTKDGAKRAVILAGHLTKFNQKARINMDEGVAVDFFDEAQSHLSHLTSQQAQVNEKTNDLLAEGNVVVVSDSGVTLYTEQLRWSHAKERIVSDVFITLVTEQDTLTGIGFESDSNLENWIIQQPSGVTNREIGK